MSKHENPNLASMLETTVKAAMASRDAIIESAFRKEFGNPEEMTQEEIMSAAAQCHQECQLVEGVNHFRFIRNEESGPRLLVEVVQTIDGNMLNTSFRSEIGDLGLGGE